MTNFVYGILQKCETPHMCIVYVKQNDDETCTFVSMLRLYFLILKQKKERRRKSHDLLKVGKLLVCVYYVCSISSIEFITR